MKNHQSQLFDQIKETLSSHVNAYDPKKLQITPLSGLTNETFKITCEGRPSLLFRKFGGSLDRNAQNQIFKVLEQSLIAPKCYYACEEYRIQLFIENSQHPSIKQLQNSELKKKILEVMYRYHQCQIDILKNKPLFIEEILSFKHFEKIIPHKDKSNEIKFKELYQKVQAQYTKIDQIKSELLQEKSETSKNKIKFCHNDLNNLNIFSKPKVILIDYEYSAYNYFYYDIANFLNECTINYKVNDYPHFRVQRRLTIQQIKNDVKLYPETYPELQKDVLKGLVACNLYWGSWSVIMAFDASQGSFGTVEHGLARMDLYQYYKKMLETI